MKVVILTNEYPPHVYGGAGVHVEYLTRALADHAEVQVFSFGDQDITKGNLKVQGLESDVVMEVHDARFAKMFDTLQRNLKMAAAVQEADIVHCHTWYSHLAGCLVKQLSGARLVLTTHSLEPHRPWKVEQLGAAYHASSWIEQTAYENADGVIAVSDQMLSDVTSLYRVDPERVTVIPNGIDAGEYKPTIDPDVLERNGIDPEIPYVLFVGRITRQKGIIHLVNAIERLTPGMQVVLAAGAPDTPEIAKEMESKVSRVQEAGTHPVVWIEEMLPRPEIITLYSHARVFVCPSVYEPFGIINLEAMACETAVVASRVGGIPAVVQHEKTGLMVDYNPDNFAATLAQALNRLMADPALCAEYGRRGRTRVKEHFSWEAIARQTHRYYQTLL